MEMAKRLPIEAITNRTRTVFMTASRLSVLGLPSASRQTRI